MSTQYVGVVDKGNLTIYGPRNQVAASMAIRPNADVVEITSKLVAILESQDTQTVTAPTVTTTPTTKRRTGKPGRKPGQSPIMPRSVFVSILNEHGAFSPETAMPRQALVDAAIAHVKANGRTVTVNDASGRLSAMWAPTAGTPPFACIGDRNTGYRYYINSGPDPRLDGQPGVALHTDTVAVSPAPTY